MKTLLLAALLLFAGGLFISADVRNNDISRDASFRNSVILISSLGSNIQALTEAQFNEEFKKIANSIAELKEKYPDLNNPTLTSDFVNNAFDKLARENRNTIHGDTCFKDFVRAIFACFQACSNHQALKACFATACADFKVCKEGGPRR